MSKFKKLTEIGLALKPRIQEFRSFHVAGIFKKNKLISLAANTKKTHSFAFKNNYPWAAQGLHAECLAIIRGRLESYSGFDLIVIRIDNNEKLNYSKPCKWCAALIRRMNFDSVSFSNEEGKIERFKIN